MWNIFDACWLIGMIWTNMKRRVTVCEYNYYTSSFLLSLSLFIVSSFFLFFFFFFFNSLLQINLGNSCKLNRVDGSDKMWMCGYIEPGAYDQLWKHIKQGLVIQLQNSPVFMVSFSNEIKVIPSIIIQKKLIIVFFSGHYLIS